MGILSGIASLALIATTLAESYDLRISGISTHPDKSLRVYGTIKPHSEETDSSAEIAPRSGEFSLDSLRPGECYKNLCFHGLSENKKEILFSYKKHDEWEWSSIPASGSNQTFAVDMDPIPGIRHSLQAGLDLWHQLFPDSWMLTAGETSLQTAKVPLIFKDGRFTTNSQEYLSGPPTVTDALNYILKNKKFEIRNGIPTLTEPVESCAALRTELSGGEFNEYALSISIFRNRLIALCKLNDGKIGYCSPETFDSSLQTDDCLPLKEYKPANECGHSELSLQDDPINEIGVKVKDGMPCQAKSKPIDISIGSSSEPNHPLNFFLILEEGFSREGFCEHGTCRSRDTDMCAGRTMSGDHLLFSEREFVDLFGEEIFQKVVERKTSDLNKNSKFSSFFHKKENLEKYDIKQIQKEIFGPFIQPEPDGAVCPGGLCQSGKCIPFKSLLGESGGSEKCRNLENGNPCQFLTDKSTSQGFCFQNECHLCDPKIAGRLVGAPACPENPAYPGVIGYRKSCSSPDVCSYL